MQTEQQSPPTETDPTTMHAVVQHRYGAPEQVLELAEIPRPEIGADEVLVRVRATSVNTPDWITTTGVPYVLRLRFGLFGPPTPVRGTDIAGVVEAVGSGVETFTPGDEVFGSAWNGSLATKGTFAEYAVAPASQMITKPAWLSFEHAAASVMSGLTAMAAMRDVGEVTEGTRVLVNGASGGVGLLAVQIAKALGAEVTGVASTRNLELLRSVGADHVIDYTTENFTERDERYDVILDNVINHSPKAVARALAPGGTFLPNSVGNSGGFFAGLTRMARAMIMGMGSTDVRAVDWEVTRQNLSDLTAFLGNGVEVVIDTTYPLAEAGAAVAHMLGHHASGKIGIVV